MKMDMPAMGMEEAMSEEEQLDEVISFAPPKGFTPPDDMEEGKPFDIVASMVMKGGKLTLQSVNGAKLSQMEEDTEETEETEDMEEESSDSSQPAEDGGATLASEIKKAGYGR
jgi:hypothetical protein